MHKKVCLCIFFLADAMFLFIGNGANEPDK